jgi:hypothetical protein
MQPYFFPYLGYFRLFAVADEFVILDTAQFRRGGRIHRSEVPGPNGVMEWLTLPLARQPLATPIRELAFAPRARESFDKRLARLPWISTADGPASSRMRAFLKSPTVSVLDYLETGLRLVVDILGLEATILRASSLDLDASLRGQACVIVIARMRGATRYVNSPGGRDLYHSEAFAKCGIELAFLTPYEGRYQHMIPALMTESGKTIRRDLDANTAIVSG